MNARVRPTTICKLQTEGIIPQNVQKRKGALLDKDSWTKCHIGRNMLDEISQWTKCPIGVIALWRKSVGRTVL